MNDDNSICSLSLPEYDIIKTIGTGAFGRVYFVKHKTTKQPYALKALKKSKLILQNQITYTFSEYNILKNINHPFLVSLNKFFQDKKYIFFLLDYIPGGELFTLMRTEVTFSPVNARFYIAQLIEAICYLHSKKIIYRDLKPENILFDEKGYVKLTDFGVAKEISGKTFTLCGTPNYLAPEVVLKKGYSFPADWWSLGVLSYEMMVGMDPWDENDPLMIYQKIIAGKIYFPKGMCKEAKSFIQHLMVGDPEKRMGSGVKNGKNDIYSHRWFKDFDWDALINKTIKAWHVPKLKNNEDTTNYNEYPESDSEGEDISSEDDPFKNW